MEDEIYMKQCTRCMRIFANSVKSLLTPKSLQFFVLKMGVFKNFDTHPLEFNGKF
jgi:hypothetical protein